MNKTEAIISIRMLLSGRDLVTVREADPAKVREPLIETTPQDLEENIRKLSTMPASIRIEGTGTFIVADCPANIEIPHAQKFGRQRMKNRIVIITGGAQGLGAGLVNSFFEEGANVVIADIREEEGRSLETAYNKRPTPNKALFIHTDVADPGSVQNLVDETVLFFGGLDVMISNAGILYAGGLDEISPETFSAMTRINYEGYFNCARAAAVVMKMQAARSADRFFDIIQINSKSGLKGSNKNFAYSGGKFGGIGLTQSFALELIPYRIKVNAICPGNYFDGPLWSDPDNGLFVQYLKAGKVPGAATIDDVRKHYEKQVPAGRGCRIEDLARAVFYAIEQEYETGQAIPVTGGQIMLH